MRGTWLRRVGTRLATVMALATAGMLVPVGPIDRVSATGTAGFYDGVIKYSTIVNCASIIFPPMYTESGVGAYVGVYADPDQGIPRVNDTAYMRIVVYGLGNACSGQRIIPSFTLPAGATLNTSEPIQCSYSGTWLTNATDCPQYGNLWTGLGTVDGDYAYVSTDTANARTWPVPQGKYLEFRFPITSDRTQVNTTIYSYTKVFDGNDNPSVPNRVPYYVYGGTPFIRFDTPSTASATTTPVSGPTAYGLLSKGQFYTGFQAGTLSFQAGTASGVYQPAWGWSGAVDNSNDNWEFWTDWEGLLTPGQRYYWKLTFVPNSGPTIVGAEQSFVAPSQCGGRWPTVNLAWGEAPTSGNDVILGTSRSESISALAGNDIVCAGGGNDTIIGGSGNDRIFGGSGRDTASYAGWGSGVTVSLAITGAQSTGAGSDTLSGVESLIGSSKGDRLTGNSAGNDLGGGGGADTLNGGGGADDLAGGSGTDTCNGGSGTDSASGCEIVTGVP